MQGPEARIDVVEEESPQVIFPNEPYLTHGSGLGGARVAAVRDAFLEAENIAWLRGVGAVVRARGELDGSPAENEDPGARLALAEQADSRRKNLHFSDRAKRVG
jgi:hypothetical protein